MTTKIEESMTPEQQELQAKIEAQAREIGHALDHALNPEMRSPRDSKRRTVGFALLVFSFSEPPTTYISNANRDDMIRAIEEWLERAKARV